MKKEDLFKIIGPLIYILAYFINKLIIKIPDTIYMVIIIISIGFLLSGLLLSYKKKTF